MKTCRLNVRVTPELKRPVKLAAGLRGMTVTIWLETAIRAVIRKQLGDPSSDR